MHSSHILTCTNVHEVIEYLLCFHLFVSIQCRSAYVLIPPEYKLMRGGKQSIRSYIEEQKNKIKKNPRICLLSSECKFLIHSSSRYSSLWKVYWGRKSTHSYRKKCALPSSTCELICSNSWNLLLFKTGWWKVASKQYIQFFLVLGYHVNLRRVKCSEPSNKQANISNGN